MPFPSAQPAPDDGRNPPPQPLGAGRGLAVESVEDAADGRRFAAFAAWAERGGEGVTGRAASEVAWRGVACGIEVLAPGLGARARQVGLLVEDGAGSRATLPLTGDLDGLAVTVTGGTSVRLDLAFADASAVKGVHGVPAPRSGEPGEVRGYAQATLVDAGGRPAALPAGEPGVKGPRIWAASVRTLDAREISRPRRDAVRPGVGVLGLSPARAGDGDEARSGRARVLVGKPVEAHEMVIVTVLGDVASLLGRPLEQAVLRIAQEQAHAWAFAPERPETAGWSARLLQRIGEVVFVDPVSGFTASVTVPPATRRPRCTLFGSFTTGRFHLAA